MVMEILHQTLHQLKVCDNTHILYSTCTAMLHSFMLCTCLCFIIGSDNEDDSTNTSQETQVVVSATAGMYMYTLIHTHIKMVCYFDTILCAKRLSQILTHYTPC